MKLNSKENQFLIFGLFILVLNGVTQLGCNKTNGQKTDFSQSHVTTIESKPVPATKLSDSIVYGNFLKSVFGSGINYFKVDGIQQPIIGDINGDGFQDSLFICEFTNSKDFTTKIVSLNPWCTNSFSGCKSTNPSIKEGPGLALVLGNKSSVSLSERAYIFQPDEENPLDCNSFAIYNGFRLIEKNKYRAIVDSLGIQEQIEAPQGDLVALGTPGTGDNYLYFDGKIFKIFWPKSGDD